MTLTFYTNYGHYRDNYGLLLWGWNLYTSLNLPEKKWGNRSTLTKILWTMTLLILWVQENRDYQLSLACQLSKKKKKKHKNCISCTQLRNSMGETVGNVEITEWSLLITFFETWTSRFDIKSYNDHVSLRYHLAFQSFSLLNSKRRVWIHWWLAIDSL